MLLTSYLSYYVFTRISMAPITQNVVEKLLPDFFLKIQSRAYPWINSLKSFMRFVFIVCQV